MSQQNEDTICCICIDTYKDPRNLPCMHTFCIKCLQETGLKANKGPGDEMSCPICRQIFIIPLESLTGLPKNFFLETLIDMTQESSPTTKTSLCDACSEEKEEDVAKEIPAANTYCIDCKQKLCEECTKFHKKLKLCKNHRLVPISEQHTESGITTESIKPISCEVHDEKILDVYCAECQTVVCAICFIENHEGHKGFHVDKVVNQFRKVLEQNIESLKAHSSQAQLKKSELEEAKRDFQQKLFSLECDIAHRKDALKEIADKHAKSLLEELCTVKQKTSKDLQIEIDDFDTYLLTVESYCSHCVKTIAHGFASDICCDVCNLSARAKELDEQSQRLLERKFQPSGMDLCFRKSEFEAFLEEEGSNMIGEITDRNDSNKSKINFCKEIVILKKDIEQKRTAQESLKLTIENLTLELNRVEQTKIALMSEMDQEKARNNENGNKLKHEQDINKTIRTDNVILKMDLEKVKHANIVLQRENSSLKERLISEQLTVKTLQATNDQMQLELDREKTTNKTLQSNFMRLQQQFDSGEMARRTLQSNHDKLKLKLETERKSSDTLIHTIEKLKEELRNKTEKCGDLYKSDAVLVQTFRTKVGEEGKKPIYGLAILDQELFVISRWSSQVDVYDSIKFSFVLDFKLKELLDPIDIVSCNSNKCLYIMDFRGSDMWKEILRVDPSGNVIKVLSSRLDFGRLSVTNESNVILTVYQTSKLNEYTPDGLFIRQIDLSHDAGIRHPWHAVKLTNGDFVVSHGFFDDSVHRVCIVDEDGNFKKSFPNVKGSSVGQLHHPKYMTIDRNGFILVSDCNNSRVLLMDSDLEFKKEILTNEKHGLRCPERICLDETNGRLFVADNDSHSKSTIWRDGRILVFDLGTVDK